MNTNNITCISLMTSQLRTMHMHHAYINDNCATQHLYHSPHEATHTHTYTRGAEISTTANAAQKKRLGHP